MHALPPDPNIAVLPAELAACALIVAVGLALLRWSSRKDGAR